MNAETSTSPWWRSGNAKTGPTMLTFKLKWKNTATQEVQAINLADALYRFTVGLKARGANPKREDIEVQ